MKPPTVLICVMILLGACFASVQIGIRMGRALTEADFEGPSRAIGAALAELDAEMKSGNHDIVAERLSYLSKNWHSIDFFGHRIAEGRTLWPLFFMEYEKLPQKEKEPNNAVELTPASVTPPAVAGAAPLASVAHLGR
jgi:hypothetical protein